MLDPLQAALTSQLGEEQAREVYARLVDTALHLHESLSPVARDVPGIAEGSVPTSEELLDARLRNTARLVLLRKRILEGSLSGRELADHLGVSPQAVDQARQANKVIALRASGGWRYPVWQFDFSAPDPLPPHLAEVAAAVGEFRLALIRWLSEHDETLGSSPLDALRTDHWQQVVRRARQLFITAT